MERRESKVLVVVRIIDPGNPFKPVGKSKYKSVLGAELVSWLLLNTSLDNREDALKYIKSLVDAGLLDQDAPTNDEVVYTITKEAAKEITLMMGKSKESLKATKRKSGVPVPRNSKGARSHSTVGNFGVSLETLSKREGGASIPAFLISIIQYLDKNALSTQGIFRIVPDSAQLHWLEEITDKLEFPMELTLFNFKDVHMACCLLKAWLRKLPVPLLHPFDAFVEIAPENETQVGASKTVNALKKQVEKLPKTHLATLDYLVGFLRRVTDNHEKNKMTVYNVSSLMGPNILSRTQAPSNPNDLFNDASKAVLITMVLIQSYYVIFGSADTKDNKTTDEIKIVDDFHSFTPKLSPILNSPGEADLLETCRTKRSLSDSARNTPPKRQHISRKRKTRNCQDTEPDTEIQVETITNTTTQSICEISSLNASVTTVTTKTITAITTTSGSSTIPTTPVSKRKIRGRTHSSPPKITPEVKLKPKALEEVLKHTKESRVEEIESGAEESEELKLSARNQNLKSSRRERHKSKRASSKGALSPRRKEGDKEDGRSVLREQSRSKELNGRENMPRESAIKENLKRKNMIRSRTEERVNLVHSAGKITETNSSNKLYIEPTQSHFLYRRKVYPREKHIICKEQTKQEENGPTDAQATTQLPQPARPDFDQLTKEIEAICLEIRTGSFLPDANMVPSTPPTSARETKYAQEKENLTPRGLRRSRNRNRYSYSQSNLASSTPNSKHQSENSWRNKRFSWDSCFSNGLSKPFGQPQSTQCEMLRRTESLFYRKMSMITQKENSKGWLVLGYSGPTSLYVQAFGLDGLSSLKENLFNDEVQFAFLRLPCKDSQEDTPVTQTERDIPPSPSRSPLRPINSNIFSPPLSPSCVSPYRDIFLVWIGPLVNTVSKACKANHVAQISQLFQPFDVQVTVLSKKKFTEAQLQLVSLPHSNTRVID